MHSDSKKRRSFLALLFAAGDVKRYAREAALGPGDNEIKRENGCLYLVKY
ncbi:hypothetical protein C8R11_1303 [Nitrosomonas aestuarii]|nr:hypothetical protein C8R11_1303 [Nitrosomonas aestuarii]